MAVTRCAVYVRKSTEHGLEQEFNSLDNQEAACKAYIASQAFNNWEYYKTYEDGGISGGTMERPGLQQMLVDMANGLIQVVVVYKVDRLSRSILDFHTMMKTFDKYNCNFVSITQSFDTSNSMGKLTLNMLLSFAQFEREVSSERVRDKIRASRARGIWTGGIPFLGYDCIDKKLVINETEAEQVRQIFELYLQVGSVIELAQELRRRGIFNKKWTTHKGEPRGGSALTTNSLHRLLREKIYIGVMEHKAIGTTADGEHKPIITKELFDAVQERLCDNSNGKYGKSKASPNLLSGKIYTADGVKFVTGLSKHKTNGRATYYYAAKKNFIRNTDIDCVVMATIQEFMDADLSSLSPEYATKLKRINYADMDFIGRSSFIKTIIEKAIVSDKKITLFINQNSESINRFITDTFINQKNNPMQFIVSNDSIIIERDIVINKGKQLTKYNPGHRGLITMTENNHLIVRAFALAWKYRDTFEKLGSLDEAVAAEKTSWRSLYRYLNLAYLHPNKVNAIMSGKENYTVEELLNIAGKYQL